MNTYQIRIATTSTELEKLLKPWDMLYRESGSDDPFLMPWWYSSLFQWGCPDGSCSVWSAWNGSQLVAVAPIKTEMFKLPGCKIPIIRHALSGPADYEQFLCRQGHDVALTEILRTLYTKYRPAAFALREVPADSSLWSWLDSLNGFGFTILVYSGQLCPRLSVEGSLDDYWRTRYPARQKRSRQRACKLLRAGSTIVTTEDDLISGKASIDELVRIEKAGWKKNEKGGLFSSDWRQRFYTQAFTDLAKARALQLAIVTSCGMPAAFAVGIRSNQTLLQYQTSFDPAFAQQSAGLATMLLTIEDAFKGNYRFLDFARGPHTYKNELTALARRNYQVYIFKSKLNAAVFSTIRAFRSGMKRLIRKTRESWDGEISVKPDIKTLS
jgi:CelD/BcsL family acetyltransferase involved in cellulose biosynthesis